MKPLPIRIWLGFALLLIVGIPLATMATTTAIFVHKREQAAADLDALRQDVAANVERWSDPAWQASLATRLAAMHTDIVLRDSTGREVYRSAPDVSVPSIAVTPPDTAYLPIGKPQPSGEAQSIGIFSVAGGTRAAPPGDHFTTVTNGLLRPTTEVMVLDGNQRAGSVSLFVGNGTPVGAPYQINLINQWMLELAGPSGPPVALAGFVALLITGTAVTWWLGHALLRPLAATSAAARQIAAGELDFTLPTSRVREVADVGRAFQAMGDALRASLEQQAAVEGERRLFIAAIVHDLRTPLFSLRGFLDGLATGLAETPEKADRYLAICRRKAMALDRLVSDLSAYARIEYLEQAVQGETVAFGELIHSLVEGVQPQVAAKAINLTLEEPDTPVMIHADIHLLARAIENVLDNALRYTPDGGTVRVRWWLAGERVTFSVADGGPGIAPGDLPHLFSPFFRGESSRNPGTGGIGLGLTIARRILRAHGGDLVAANAPEAGAIFTGHLPLDAGAATVLLPPGPFPAREGERALVR